MNSNGVSEYMNKINFSVVICTLHNYIGLEQCITSITQQTVKPREVIIVHGGENDEISKSIEEKIHPILQSNFIILKYIKTMKSLVIQRNIGIDNADCDVIVFFDDDVILEVDYFYFLSELYQSKWDDCLGGIQGAIIENLGIKPWYPREILRKIFFLTNQTGNGRLQPSAHPSFCNNSKKIKKVDIFSGCMMSFRRDILLKHKFDENMQEYWMLDDVELSYRISRKYNLYQTPFAKLHHISSSPNYEGRKKIARMLVVNRLYLFRLYFSNSKINRLIFLWSTIGEFTLRIFVCIELFNIGPLSGFLEGWKLVFTKRSNIIQNRIDTSKNGKS
jgi:glycosyltransferase involved in cell wall biosynthesis